MIKSDSRHGTSPGLRNSHRSQLRTIKLSGQDRLNLHRILLCVARPTEYGQLSSRP